MYRKILIALLAGSLLVAGFGCSKKEAADNSAQTGQQLPNGSASSTPATPINGDEVADKVTKALDAKYPGEWTVSGTTLKKGSYQENGSYKIVDEVEKLYPGGMISIFVGETRISSTIKENGKPVLEGYPTPEDVPATMKSGKIKVTDAGAMGSSSYQKVYLPLKSGDQTVAVMTLSIPQ